MLFIIISIEIKFMKNDFTFVNHKQRSLMNIKLPDININSIYENLNQKKNFIDNYENILDLFSTDREKNQIVDKRKGNNFSRMDRKNLVLKNRISSVNKEKIGVDSLKNKVISENRINVHNYKKLNNFETSIYTSYVQDDIDFLKTLLASIENKKEKNTEKNMSKYFRLKMHTLETNQNLSTNDTDYLPNVLNTVKSVNSNNKITVRHII
jgi:hypothetical protein